MFEYSKSNFNKYIKPEISKWNKRLLFITLLGALGVYFICTPTFKTLPAIFKFPIGILSTGFLLISAIMFPTLNYSYKRTAREFCQGYQIQVKNNAIMFCTMKSTNIEGNQETKFKKYTIRKVDNLIDKNGKIIIFGDILLEQFDPFMKKIKIKKYKKNKCYIIKGISNIEEFKQELEKLK